MTDNIFALYDPQADNPPVKDDKFWKPESEEFHSAVAQLIQKDFSFIDHLNIVFLFRDKHGTHCGNAVWGHCQKQSDKQKELHGFDVAIVIAWDIWSVIDNIKREALIYHELSHIGIDPETDNVTMQAHDLEFFRGEFRKYGAWSTELEGLVNDLQQMELFKREKHNGMKDDDES